MQLTKSTLTQIATIARIYRADEDDLRYEVLDQIADFGRDVVLYRGRLTDEAYRSVVLFALTPTRERPFAGRWR